ncbi:hypothetical protein C0J52_00293 [Blattella germanica]|nr:hypothetical protein C0J52_00293 [Blattella germanica]
MYKWFHQSEHSHISMLKRNIDYSRNTSSASKSKSICDRSEHQFLMSGHSFSASDREFALIEKRAKCFKMHTVEDIKTVISVARPNRPYRVLDMRKVLRL